jgi:hypothetical protein
MFGICTSVTRVLQGMYTISNYAHQHQYKGAIDEKTCFTQEPVSGERHGVEQLGHGAERDVQNWIDFAHDWPIRFDRQTN